MKRSVLSSLETKASSAGLAQAPRSIDFQNNAIGALRLIFAAAVVVSHAYPLGGFGEDFAARWSGNRENLGNLAVAGFFVLSGLLIARSAARMTFGRFLWHRFLRIFPAFWACLIVTALVFAPLAAAIEHRSSPLLAPWGSDGPLRYLAFNADLTMRQYGISGLLGALAEKGVFDGSLWTLRFEFVCYVAIAVIAAFGILARQRTVFAVGAGLLYVAYAVPIAFQGRLPAPWSFDLLLRGQNRLGAELIVYFAAGALAYLYRDRISLRTDLGVTTGVVTLFALRSPAYSLVLPITLSYATLWLAARLPLRNIDRRVDVSYGLYIYAFPLQQLAADAGLAREGLPFFTLIAMVGALALAALSWFAIERPALRCKGFMIPLLRSIKSGP